MDYKREELEDALILLASNIGLSDIHTKNLISSIGIFNTIKELIYYYHCTMTGYDFEGLENEEDLENSYYIMDTYIMEMNKNGQVRFLS